MNESTRAYQNHVLNAYLWALVGVLFRLLTLLASASVGNEARAATRV